MKCTGLLILLTTLSMTMVNGGCAGSHPSHPHDASFSAHGDDTNVSIDFDAHPAAEVPHELTGEEMCYLTFGGTMIVCQSDGSYVLFGSDDGAPLISDNPLYRLRLGDDDDASGMKASGILGTLFLVAGSVERFPAAVAGYVGDAGPNRSVALAAARIMLDRKGAVFIGSARGGTFSVSVQLTEAGMTKLRDALLADDKLEGIYRVRGPKPPPLAGHEAIFTPGKLPHSSVRE